MMHLLRLIPGTLLGLQIAVAASAQAPPAQPPIEAPRSRPATQTPQTRPAAASLTLAVQVTDQSGNPIPDVAVAASGPVDRSATTGRDGTVAFRSMRSGQYRLRFEREGFVTLEREQMVRPQAAEVSVALNAAPAKPVPPPPPAPEQPKPVERAPARAVEPRYLDIPGYVERNLVSEPQKTTTIACTDGGTARIYQVRDPVTNRQHADYDEVLYVVAGAGVVRIRDQDTKMNPGAFMLIPRGVPHNVRRDGRNPMITLSVFMGAPCHDGSAAVR